MESLERSRIMTVPSHIMKTFSQEPSLSATLSTVGTFCLQDGAPCPTGAHGGRRARVEPTTLHLQIHRAHHGHGPVCGCLRFRKERPNVCASVGVATESHSTACGHTFCSLGYGQINKWNGLPVQTEVNVC
jgi:hypothetical protein